MSIDYVIDKDKRLILMSLIGNLSKDDIIQSFEKVAMDPLFHDDYNIISDIREAVFTTTHSERIALHKYFKDRIPQSIGRSAFVVETQLDTAFAFLFSEDLKKKREIRVFSSMDSALRWLGYLEEEDADESENPPA